MDITILPSNIIEMILSKINDTNTYFNSRLVCKKWYKKLKNILIFENYYLEKKIKFDKNEITIFDKSGNIINKCFIKIYGGFVYKTYQNGQCIDTISVNSPYSVKKRTLDKYNYKNVEYNIKDNKETITYENIPIPPCTVL